MLRIAKTHNMCWYICDYDALSETHAPSPKPLLKRAIVVEVLVHVHLLKYSLVPLANQCRSLVPLTTTSDF